ncbi:MAG: helix-turn-helix transcriptional regulator [Planctomycetes bacterium]|nr:helix-turn-helix transcriptional regulator [Planctomycetota bacterium]
MGEDEVESEELLVQKNKYSILFCCKVSEYRLFLYIMAKQFDIDEQLRQLLAKNQMTRYRLAKLTGISESFLSLFLWGKRNIGLRMAEKLADKMGYKLTLQPKRTSKKGR